MYSADGIISDFDNLLKTINDYKNGEITYADISSYFSNKQVRIPKKLLDSFDSIPKELSKFIQVYESDSTSIDIIFNKEV